jgi:hypothetical protein
VALLALGWSAQHFARDAHLARTLV